MLLMKKEFISPEMEIVEFETEDFISAVLPFPISVMLMAYSGIKRGV